MPVLSAYLGKAYAELGAFEDASLRINEALNAIEINSERWCEAEVNSIAGEIALMSSEPDVTKAEVYFERALAVAREQQAKSWELRAAMSMARLWRDQGKRQQAQDLLAPVYGWFTEGFDTLDLKEAKALLSANEDILRALANGAKPKQQVDAENKIDVLNHTVALLRDQLADMHKQQDRWQSRAERVSLTASY
jgi:hypothetical protein